MKKILLSATAIVLTATVGYCQQPWTDDGGTKCYLKNSYDYVGINVSSPTVALEVDGDAIFNTTGADKDFIVESDAQTHMIFVDAGNNRVGIANSAPSHTLDVTGDIDHTGSIYKSGTVFIHNQGGSANYFAGLYAGLDITTGYSNTGVGYEALTNTTTGVNLVGIGQDALALNTTGGYNTAVGSAAMIANTSGSYNTAIGLSALSTNTTGYNNVAVGASALLNNTTGFNNSALGNNSGPSTSNLSNTTSLGNGAVTTASNTISVGNTSVTSIKGQVSFTTYSDGRFKNAIKEDITGLAFINQLRPVSYVVDKNALNDFLGVKSDKSVNTSMRETGFIAQEVEKVVHEGGYAFNGVDVPQNEKSHYGLRYAEFVVPLVKSVQELSAIVEEQRARIEELESLKNENPVNKVKEGFDVQKGASKLFQNDPNPFTVNTEIKMNLAQETTKATVYVYDLNGKQIKEINVDTRGETSINLNGGDLKAGMYVYALVVDGKAVDSKRMILTK